jgi:hypothetical protein
MKQQTVVDHAPAARCYRCGSTRVYSLCHHCRRPMCEEHSPLAFRQAGGPAREPSATAQPASKEFAWLLKHKKKFARLKQNSLRRAVYHCEDHKHGSGWLAALLAGRKGQGNLAPPPPLPLFPHVNTVDVVERLAGEIRFDGESYTGTPQLPVMGEIAVEMSVGDAAGWLDLYRSKYAKQYRLAADDPVTFVAGFAMIRGKAGLRFTAGQEVVLADGMGLTFSGTSAGHPVFQHSPGRPPGEWLISAGYEVRPERAPKEIPLWIVPSITPSEDRRTLEVDLHWNQLDADGRKLSLTQFELIELVVPASWGVVQGVEPSGPTIALDNGRRTIRWERVPAKDSLGKSLTLRFHFERPVLPGPDDDVSADAPNPTFGGTLKAVFGETLSGVEGVDIYLPGGRLAHEGQGPETKVRTEVTVGFKISLADLRYQDDWVVPDDSNAKAKRDAQNLGQRNGGGEQRAHLRNKTDEFIGVVPDYQTVTELTNLISEDGYYVKSVVEHLPFRDDGRGNVVNRVWDIAGRWYEGVFPVDFDINLRGEELGADDGRGLSGKTIAQVTVKGAYVNERELAQRAMIVQRWDTLHGHVTGLLGRRAGGDDGVRAIASAGLGGWGDLAHGVTLGGGDANGERFDHDTVIVDAEIVEEPVVNRIYDDRPERIAELLRKQSAADDAVIAGRLSEDNHRGIIARIQAELRELGG